MRRVFTLRGASWVFAVTWLVHTVDHVRRGVDATSDAVVWAGSSVAMLAAIALTLVAVGHDRAPMAVAVVFPSIAIGVSATHLLPAWGALSDPVLVESTTDVWSIVAVSGEIIGALLLGFAGVRLLASHGYATRVPAERWA